MCALTRRPREVAFILRPFSAATWWESCERDTIPSVGTETESPFSTPEGPRERGTLCVCMWTEEREMAIDPNEGDGNEKGPSMCTSASQNISAFTELTIESRDAQLATCCMRRYLDVNVDLKWREGCDCTPGPQFAFVCVCTHIILFIGLARMDDQAKDVIGIKWSIYVKLHRLKNPSWIWYIWSLLAMCNNIRSQWWLDRLWEKQTAL